MRQRDWIEYLRSGFSVSAQARQALVLIKDLTLAILGLCGALLFLAIQMTPS